MSISKDQIITAAAGVHIKDNSRFDFITKCNSYISKNHWLKQELSEEQVKFAARTTLSEKDATALLAYLGLDYNNNTPIIKAIKTMSREELEFLFRKVYKQGRLDYASRINDLSFEDGKFLDEDEDFIYRNWDDYLCK